MCILSTKEFPTSDLIIPFLYYMYYLLLNLEATYSTKKGWLGASA